MTRTTAIFLTFWLFLLAALSSAAGNLVNVLEGEGVYWGPNSAHTTDFSYDGLNRKIAQTWDKGAQSWGAYTPKGTLHWTYDALVMTQSANARGETTSYEYDGLLRPITLTYSNANTPLCRLYYQGASTATPAAGYASGPGPLLASLHPSSGSALYQDTLTTYDRLDRVLSETSAGETHSYSYDVAGNRILTTYAKTGRKLVTQYDSLGRVTRIIDTSATFTDPAGYAPGGTDLVTSYAYDIGGLVLRKNQANHTSTLNTYDLRGRLSTTRTRYYPLGGGGETNADLSAFDYSQPQSGDTAHTSGYDNLGNVIHVVETYSGLPARDVLNSYDRTNRLVTEQDTDSGHTTLTSYTYTENNSRYDRTVRIDSGPSHTTRFRYGNPNIGYNSDQLYGISKLDVNAQPGDDSTFKYRYTYDADGNRATRVTDPGTAAEKVDHYVYDQRNRLLAVTTTQTSSGAVVGSNGYVYDERTRRTSTAEGYPAGTLRRLSFSGGSYVQEYGVSTGSLPSLQLVRGSDMGGGVGGILYNDGVSGVTFNNYNSRGDVVSQTNTGGASTWAGKYDAFGTHTDTSTTSAVGRQRANSKDEDPTGLLNEGMRYRDLEAGLFLTRDPAGLVDGPNVYTYVRQNPWTKFDALGLYEVPGGGVSNDWIDTSHALMANPNASFGDRMKAMVYGIAGAVKVIPEAITYSSSQAKKGLANSSVEIGKREESGEISPAAATFAYVATKTFGEAPVLAFDIVHFEPVMRLLDGNPKTNANLSELAGSVMIPEFGEEPSSGESARSVAEGPVKPNYTEIPNPKNLDASTKPTPRQAREMKRMNMEANGGVLRDDVTGEIMAPSSKSQGGVTPPSNEVQVDHKLPVDKGGTRDMSNLELRTRANNREKSNKYEEPVKEGDSDQ